MEGIFETVTVTARVWSTSRYREKILSLFCRVKNSDMGNGKSWKWAPRQIKIHRTKKEKSKGRGRKWSTKRITLEWHQGAKELEWFVILFWNKKVTTVSRNWSRTYSITCIANRSTKITRIYEKSLRLLIVEKWNENSRSYDRRISSQQNRTSFIKMEYRLESQLGKGWIIKPNENYNFENILFSWLKNITKNIIYDIINF